MDKQPPQESKDFALRAAAYRGDAEIVKLLLVAGANPTAKAKKPKSAVQYAAEQGHADVVEILKKAGAKDEPKAVAVQSEDLRPVDPAKMTKAEWRQALAPYNINSPQWRRGLLTEEGFKARLGKPAKEQRLGSRAYWYYQCSDGDIQVVIDADFLEQQGVIIKSVNEF